MADITPTAGDYIRPHRSPWGNFATRGFPLSTGISSNAIALGAVVGLDVNSTAYRNCIVPSSMTSNTVISTAIVGIAAESASAPSSTNTQGSIIPVWEANPQMEFRARTRNGLLNSTMVGEPHDLLWDSTAKIHLVNAGASSFASTPVRVIVTELLDNVGDSGGAVAFRFPTMDVTSSVSTAHILAFFK
jgi:hypothetical protein